MKKYTINETLLSIRKTWGNIKPVSKAFKSKRDYNRKDKSWMKDV